MTNEKDSEKKGLFLRLAGSKKAKKDSCCCSIELEEVTEDKPDNKENKDKEQ